MYTGKPFSSDYHRQQKSSLDNVCITFQREASCIRSFPYNRHHCIPGNTIRDCA